MSYVAGGPERCNGTLACQLAAIGRATARRGPRRRTLAQGAQATARKGRLATGCPGAAPDPLPRDPDRICGLAQVRGRMDVPAPASAQPDVYDEHALSGRPGSNPAAARRCCAAA